MLPISIKKQSPNAIIPTYGSAEAAGADLYACIPDKKIYVSGMRREPVMTAQKVTIPAGKTAMISTGLAMEIPKGYAGLIYARSGLACKCGLAPATKVSVIDCDYRGEVMVPLHNHGQEDQVIQHGDRIAQLVITPVFTPGFVEVEELNDTQRGTGGFGSTGK